MKTKFFKKLSFVLALAMVLSIFAPAAGAFAAKAPKLNSTKKYLHLDVEDKNEFNFNIANKKKGWKYFWESANEDVAVVNEKNGVTTATGAGKTKITVTITDADDEEVDVLSATVTVRDNIAEVKISNGPEDGKLAVGEEFDFNRSYVTVANNTKGSESVTRWKVDPAEGATINDKGVFVATEAGEYTITARSFQSKARYNAWLKDAEANEDEVLATDTTKVVVSGSMLGAKQKDLVKFDVTFDSAMDEDAVKENLKVYLLLGTAKQQQYVKSISLDEETSTVATVEMYAEFNKGLTYVVEFPDMASVQFKATSTNYTDVVRMTIDTKNVVAAYEGGEETEIKFTLFNAEGIDITNGTDSEFGGALKDRVTFETSSTGAYIYGNKISIFEVGTVAEVKATYNTYVYDEQGKEIGTVNAASVIAGTKKATVPAGSLNKYTVAFGDDGPAWDKESVTTVPIGSTSPKLYAFVKDSADTEIKSDNDEYKDNFTFESTDDNTLFVYPDGQLYPVKEGSVVVAIKYGDTIVGYANIRVVAESKAVSYTLSDYAITLSTSEAAAVTKTVKATLKDQYGNDADPKDFKLTKLTTGTTDVSGYVNHVRDGKEITFSINYPAEAGKVVYEVEFNGMKRVLTVNLVKPSDGDTRYRLSVNNIDLNIEKAENLTKKLDIKLIGYAPNNMEVTPNVVSGSGFYVEITGPQNDLYAGKDLYTVSGSAISKIDTGTYKVVVRKDDAEGTVLDTKYFTVNDTQKPATYKVKDAYYEVEDMDVILDTCFEFLIDGTKINIKENTKLIEAVDYVGNTDTSIFIKSVKVRQMFGSDYLVHEVKINKTVYKK